MEPSKMVHNEKRASFKRIDFSKFSSIRVGPLADVYMIDSFDYPEDAYLIGSANNLLVGPQHPLLMKLSKAFDYIKIKDGKLCIGAATPGGKIVSFCRKHNIANFEFIAHLPGTLGGMLQMNAGLKEYEIFNHLHSIRFKEGYRLRDEIKYGYRKTDIDEVAFEGVFEIAEGFDISKIEMFRQMRSNQPHDPSAGSFFKNPPGDHAGRLIEAVGLKGHKIGNMAFSEMHANFMVNLGGGTFDEAIALMQLAQQKVYEHFGLWLENEVAIIDSRFMGDNDPSKPPRSGL
ncbi:UDP-N-acetylmuramate dehydrogenase [Sulfurimonas sp. HSL3-7]|uniref:UDP-N-acetylmuramate dehydrogenase n=1 Tax=Sulfonitrofixus jiaomeiensis TaxID=3131938 RepID=UPI0031F91A29